MKTESPTTKPADIRPIWVVRAAKHGDAHSLFLNSDLVALEDQGLGNLSRLGANREMYYSAYRLLHPDDSRVSIAGIAGKFFRFACEIAEGDWLLYPATKDYCVYVGMATGRYRYDTATSKAFPHQLPVIWIASIPNPAFSRTAKRELGAARMLFRIKRHENEIRRLLERLPKIKATVSRKLLQEK